MCSFSSKNGACQAVSFGLERTLRAERTMGALGCEVSAFDPALELKANVSQNVHFYKVSHPSINAAQAFRNMPVPALRPTHKILKLDCEGCELTILGSIAQHDSNFFDRIDQLLMSVHLSVAYATTPSTVVRYGLLLNHLIRRGFKLAWAATEHCTKGESAGVLTVLIDIGYMTRLSRFCELQLWTRRLDVVYNLTTNVQKSRPFAAARRTLQTLQRESSWRQTPKLLSQPTVNWYR